MVRLVAVESSRPTSADVWAAREARRARSEQDVDPRRVLRFVVATVAVAWLWLGPVWAVVAAVFVVPPWLIIAVQWRARAPHRITSDQQAAIARVRLWRDPALRWWGTAYGLTMVVVLGAGSVAPSAYNPALSLAIIVVTVAAALAPKEARWWYKRSQPAAEGHEGHDE